MNKSSSIKNRAVLVTAKGAQLKQASPPWNPTNSFFFFRICSIRPQLTKQSIAQYFDFTRAGSGRTLLKPQQWCLVTQWKKTKKALHLPVCSISRNKIRGVVENARFFLPTQLAPLFFFFLQHINVYYKEVETRSSTFARLQKNPAQSLRHISHYSRRLRAATNGQYGMQICRRKHDSKATVHNWPLIMRDPRHSQVSVFRCCILPRCLTLRPWPFVWRRSETSHVLKTL